MMPGLPALAGIAPSPPDKPAFGYGGQPGPFQVLEIYPYPYPIMSQQYKVILKKTLHSQYISRYLYYLKIQVLKAYLLPLFFMHSTIQVVNPIQIGLTD